jgi:predicted RNase H-like HicB family nuclease
VERIEAMEKALAATTWREREWFISQCLEVDIASQGKSEEESLLNL